MPSVHPLPVNPTTGQQPLAALRSFGGSNHHHHHHHHTHQSSSGGVNREVLKQLQDVAWSDEEDDPDCMVCAEPLDLSDQNFKPCQCGLQICQFCYNKLLRDDPRCPGCRRRYDTEKVVFQPVDFEEVRRVKEKKARRAKVCKQLDSMGRRHLLETRIVMKNSVYVVGMKIPGSGSPEEAISILRSNDYFGQYGKIARIFLRDRVGVSTVTNGPDPDTPSTQTGIYIVYVRREDAARAISSLDGIPAPHGPPGQVLHASYGTTRYCDAFLRGMKCDNSGCQNLHEWGGEGDTFTRNDLETALTRPAEYDARQKQQQLQPPPITQKSAWPKPSADDVDSSALPRTANWGMRPSPARPGSSASGRSSVGAVGSQRPTKIQSTLVPLRPSTSAFPPPQASSPISLNISKDKDKKKSQTMARGRSDASNASGAASGSTQASPKKKPVSFNISSSSTPLTSTASSSKASGSTSTSTTTTTTTTTTSSSTTTTTATATTTTTTTPNVPTTTPPPPPPGIAPPPGLPIPQSASTSPTKASAPVPPSAAPEPAPAEAAPASPVKSTAAMSEMEAPAQPEAGPSTYATSPVTPKQQLLTTEYPIHSPYPDFDDVFMEPDAVKIGFAYSLGMDDDELQRMLALSHEVGGFEPNPFDPLFEELPKLGIPIASLMAAQPRESLGGPYSGPFSPFAPSSPIESSSLQMTTSSDDHPPSTMTTSSEIDIAPRTSSRFEFARRASLASTGRGQSPFHGRDDWGRTPSSNGYGGGADDMRAAMAAAKAAQHGGYHPALVHLNSHVAAAAAASAAASSDSWSNGGGDAYPSQQSGYRSYPQQPRSFGASNNYGSYGSPQIDGMTHGGHGYSGPSGPNGPGGPGPANGGAGLPAPHVPPGYESYVQGPSSSPQVYGQMGYVQQRRY